MNEEAEILFKEIANGDGEALNFIRLWSSYCHTFDDLVDGDTSPTALAFAENQGLFTRLLFCPFFRRYEQDSLILRALISEAHTASEDMRKSSNPRERDWGLFLSHSGNDMLRFVALVTGGEKHLIEMSRKIRELTLKEHYGKE
jgi:hypothetical protein